jgi:glycosyltransferase involved in cell wall biosynthesis
MISIIIPTLNEESTVSEVIRRCRPYAEEIIVVDGQSTDATVEIARREGTQVDFEPAKGKGCAMRRGAESARGDILVFIDADGSHVPEDIPRLVDPILKDEADMVVGSRLLGGSSELRGGFDEFLRLTGSSLITALINWKFGARLSVSQNGFRAIRKSAFARLHLKSRHTTIEQEMNMRALSLGLRVLDVPSHEYCRQGGVSKVRVFRVWHRYLCSLLWGLLFFQAPKKAKPRT